MKSVSTEATSVWGSNDMIPFIMYNSVYHNYAGTHFPVLIVGL